MVTTSRTATEHYYDEELGCWPIIVEHDATYCIDVPICSDSVQNMMGARLLTFQKRVVIPMALRQELVEWYHTQLPSLTASRTRPAMVKVASKNAMEDRDANSILVHQNLVRIAVLAIKLSSLGEVSGERLAGRDVSYHQ
ncbi:hypothetical protein L915_18991 [Phytophthora nicotianae]|uniref:Uncharacterized protein n=2 Tax=Phytophthora nicotianae TaxID=4792 RepID=W2QZV5_PHYN3|nr:hypothetical protein PPTG_05633 [Phytophthora nicotianae INRA-310]ETK74145.1 hypothetical protein L915_18991 [Phytophthora nicotianae]ETN17994.1 hypothetical protein PPTG_05633 [Phytophthora nicotianae INRA-310]